MTSLLNTTHTVQSVLPLLADAALKGAVLVVIAAAAVFALRKKSASSRHAVWSAAVIGHLAIPVLMLILPAWKIPLLPATPWTATAPSASEEIAINPGAVSPRAIDNGISDGVAGGTAAYKTTTMQPSERGSIPSESRAVGSSVSASSLVSMIGVIAAIWVTGAALVLLRLALGTWQVGRLARFGARVEDGAWLSLTQRLANRLGVDRPLTLLRGDRLAVPVTWGIVYPAVLLPQESDNWSEEQRRFVLVHEMAHVKRFDALTQLLAQFAVALFWFDPLVWIAAHQMRVEREHACDDYVLRDGTMPSLYAGELLEMVRNIGTPRHDRAAPAFAALAMARRSEFEGRMLAILDPRLDRNTLNRRGAFMTAVIVALLTIPLAALRPFQQPTTATQPDDLPQSFKISILPIDAATKSGATASAAIAATGSGSASATTATTPTTTSATTPAARASSALALRQARWSCEKYPMGTELHGTSTHVEEQTGNGVDRWDLVFSESGHCTEAAVIGKIRFSPDERHIAQLASGGFARFRERTSSYDRAVSVTPVGDGSLRYTALVNGQPAPFDATMQDWLEGLLPTLLREIPLNVPARVARYRESGGVPAVLAMISQIRSTGARREHYLELLKGGPLSNADAERIAAQIPRDLAGSSGDLSSVLQKLPRNAFQGAAPRQALAAALDSIKSSGDKATTLQILAPTADADMLLVIAKAAERIASSGDKANFLAATAAEYLAPRKTALREAYFGVARTVPSSGDLANVLAGASAYGHADPAVTKSIVDVSKLVSSSGDVANVLAGLAANRLLQANDPATTIAAIQRTLTMGSSGDRANVLMAIAQTGVLSNNDVREAFLRAAAALPSDPDRANVLGSIARQ